MVRAQIVGATGWRLSQGERARLCLARALLADHDVLTSTNRSERWTRRQPNVFWTSYDAARAR